MATTNLALDTVPSGSLQPSVPVNSSLNKLDAAVAGTLSIALTDANTTLTEAQYQNSALVFTGTLTANRDVILPAHFPHIHVTNSTTGGFDLTFKKSGQTGVDIAAGDSALLASGVTDVVSLSGGGGGAVSSVNGDTGAVIVPVPIGVACSDETTALSTGTAKATFRMPFAMTLTAVRANLATAQTSGSIFTVDVNEAGTTILSTKLTIDNGEKTSTTAATAAVISDSALADDAEITVDIDQIGDGTAKGLKVWLIGYPA